MRLTDTCTVTRDGTTIGGARACMFGHTAGDTGLEGGQLRYVEQARVIVGPDPAILSTTDPNRLRVVHRGRAYQVTSILPRYKTHGRLHHISLDLQVVIG